MFLWFLGLLLRRHRRSGNQNNYIYLRLSLSVHMLASCETRGSISFRTVRDNGSNANIHASIQLAKRNVCPSFTIHDVIVWSVLCRCPLFVYSHSVRDCFVCVTMCFDVLWCIVLCCVVRCCVVMCCVVMCCVVMGSVVLCCVMLCFVVLSWVAFPELGGSVGLVG